MRDLTLQFTETAQEEVDRLVMELGLVPLAQTINQNRKDLPSPVMAHVTRRGLRKRALEGNNSPPRQRRHIAGGG